MGKRRRTRRRELVAHLAAVRPEVVDPRAAILGGRVLVDGHVVSNPRSLVPVGAAITVLEPRPLRGEAKLAAALTAFAVPVGDRVALDLGAAAGGFTRVLLAAGARRVYAVDAGQGQLLGSLRCDARVVNLEGVNLALLDDRLVPEVLDVVTMDLSYLSVAAAIRQLGRIAFAPDAELIALVKPMFELRRGSAPHDAASLSEALRQAAGAVEREGWHVLRGMESSVRGAGGAVEGLLHARRRSRSPGGGP